jgi:hypothetical protein
MSESRHRTRSRADALVAHYPDAPDGKSRARLAMLVIERNVLQEHSLELALMIAEGNAVYDHEVRTVSFTKAGYLQSRQVEGNT